MICIEVKRDFDFSKLDVVSIQLIDKNSMFIVYKEAK